MLPLLQFVHGTSDLFECEPCYLSQSICQQWNVAAKTNIMQLALCRAEPIDVLTNTCTAQIMHLTAATIMGPIMILYNRYDHRAARQNFEPVAIRLVV